MALGSGGRTMPARKLQLLEPQRGDASFTLQNLDHDALRSAARVNYFTVLCIQQGSGLWHVDANEYRFNGPALLFANPYQTTSMVSETASGAHLSFHANFFCIETHHAEVGCNGVLFNNIYGEPVLELGADHADEFTRIIGLMQGELSSVGLAHSEVLLSYLKVFLIKATRIKMDRDRADFQETGSKPAILSKLVELVETHYGEKRRPAEYARLLSISEKALNKIVRTHFGRTLTILIRERVLKHAKWQLLHTQKSVKEIAAGVGFSDEFYFSRLFKRSTGMAPTAFREFETRIRSGRNLSM
jgi:AraC family transcriptional regulator, transcriptional activator of pobA